MGKPIDLTGQKFGKWSVIEKAKSPDGYEHQQFWRCVCECGTEHIRKGSQLRYAERKGCKQSCQRCAATNHGMTGSSEFMIWNQMRDRCRRPAHHAFHRYGGRGISVCERWESFENFFKDMGARPSSEHSLDRIDNNADYSPENCRWTTAKTQSRNQERTVLLTHMGKTQCIMDWAIETGLSHAAISMRIKTLGWSVAEALSTPAGKPCNWRGTRHKDAKQYEYNGNKCTLHEWSQILNVSVSALQTRISRGWSTDRVFSRK